MEPLDFPAVVLALVVHAFAGDRAAWGQAMLGELAYVEGRRNRWRFVLGCARATLVAPREASRAAAPLTLALISIAVAASAGLVGFAFLMNPGLHLGASTSVYVAIFLGALVGYLIVSVAAVRTLSAAGRHTLRTAVVGGAVVAGLCGLIGAGSGVGLSQHAGEALIVGFLLAGALVGAIASRQGGRGSTGRAAAALASVVAGLSLFVVWVAELLATSAGADDVDSLRVYAAGAVVPAQPTSNLGDQLGGAIGLLVLMPLIAIAVGCLGAAVGSRRRRPVRIS